MKYNLSEITAVIKDRRSIPPELFSQRVVQKEIIENILRSGIWGPTHGNTQPWRYKVFYGNGVHTLSETLGLIYTNETDPERFTEATREKIQKRALKSSVAIVICMQRQDTEKIPEMEEIEAVACGVQNMALTATAYGLGAFWSTPAVVYGEGFKKFLKIGLKDRCLGILYLGYPEGQWPVGQRKPIEYICEWIEE